MNFQTKNRFRVYRKLITWPTIAKRLLFLKGNLVINECLTFFSQLLPAQPSVSGPMVSFLAALAEMAALAWPPFLPAVLALGSKYQQATVVFLFSVVILIPPQFPVHCPSWKVLCHQELALFAKNRKFNNRSSANQLCYSKRNQLKMDKFSNSTFVQLFQNLWKQTTKQTKTEETSSKQLEKMGLRLPFIRQRTIIMFLYCVKTLLLLILTCILDLMGIYLWSHSRSAVLRVSTSKDQDLHS